MAYFASLLSGRRKAKKLLIVTDRSNGNNGKTTFMALMTKFFGEYADCGGTKFVCKGAFDRDRDSHDAGLEPLRGKRMLLAEELKNCMKLDDAMLKKLAGGDEVIVQGRRCGSNDRFRFVWQAGIILVFNEGDCPQFDAGDNAFMSRLLIAPMRSKFVSGDPSTDPEDFEFPVSDTIKARFPFMMSALADILLDNFHDGSTSVFEHLPLAMREWQQGVAAEANPLSEWLEQVTEVTGVIADFVLLSDLKVRYEASGQIGIAKDFKRLAVAFFTNANGVERCSRDASSAGSCTASRTK